MAEKKKEMSGRTTADMVWRGPDKEKNLCEKCVFRAEDRLGGKIRGAELALCAVYPYNNKDIDIMWGKKDCDYFTDEDA